MIKIPAFLYSSITIGLVACAAGIGIGATVQGWRLGTQIAELKAEHAHAREKSATDALDTIKADTARVTQAADAFIQHQTTLSTSFAAMRQEFRNANRPKLPIDCRPDPIRMQYLESAIDAANKAAAGSKSSSTVPAAPTKTSR